MKWKRRGLILRPEGKISWMASHAQLPVLDPVSEGKFRLYFAARDQENMSRIGCATLEIRGSSFLTDIWSEPVLERGNLGTFDDSGVFPSWIVTEGDRKYLYYVGWAQGRRTRWLSGLGLAESRDGGRTYHKLSPAPLLDRTSVDPYLVGSCCVLKEGPLWRLWYTSGTGWVQKGSLEVWPPEVDPHYHVKYGESSDGIHWKRDGYVCIDYSDPGETAIARPFVLKEEGLYRMWYCHRGSAYRIGYAESHDGLSWARKDGEMVFLGSAAEWESEMQAYPFVFTHEGRTYMLYNGNDFGKAGIGLAELVP